MCPGVGICAVTRAGEWCVRERIHGLLVTDTRVPYCTGGHGHAVLIEREGNLVHEWAQCSRSGVCTIGRKCEVGEGHAVCHRLIGVDHESCLRCSICPPLAAHPALRRDGDNGDRCEWWVEADNDHGFASANASKASLTCGDFEFSVDGHICKEGSQTCDRDRALHEQCTAHEELICAEHSTRTECE